jgi:hypothetical protein
MSMYRYGYGTYKKDANDVALLRRVGVVAQVLEYLVPGQQDRCRKFFIKNLIIRT